MREKPISMRSVDRLLYNAEVRAPWSKRGGQVCGICGSSHQVFPLSGDTEFCDSLIAKGIPVCLVCWRGRGRTRDRCNP